MTMARHKVVLQDASGNILTSGTITVRNEATGALAQIKSDRAGTTPMANPYTYTAADNGVVAFHVVGGAYKITVVDAIAGTAEDRYVGIGTAQEQDANEYNTSGYQFQIEAGTSGPPTTGCIRFDSGLSSLDTATKAIVSYTTSAGSDVGAALQALDSGTKTEANRITLISQGDGTLTVFEIGTVTDHTTWGELALTYVSGATTADSSLNLQPQFSGPDGLNGSNGASALTVVRAVATSNVTIASGLENGDVVDGVTLVTGDYVLLTGQSAPAENGPYTVVASGAASRTTAFSTYNSLPGAVFSVQEGTLGAATEWSCTSVRGGTLGTTALAFSKSALRPSNNLSEVADAATARQNLGAYGAIVQRARNGSFAIAQRSMPTTDNAYALDGWRLLLENANGATVSQDTADVPTGAGYACKLVVGSGVNGKFGIWSPIENKDMLALRGDVVSLRVPLKATAGLTDGTGKIRIGIAVFTGTADSISGDPVSTWGAEGTNPTLATSWSFANTPAAISVTTSWADYLLENVSISASATNIAIMIWSDDRATTQTTDILRVGGYVTLTRGAKAAPAIVLPYLEEFTRCQRYYETGTQYFDGALRGAAVKGTSLLFRTLKRTAPSISKTDSGAATTADLITITGARFYTGVDSAIQTDWVANADL